MTSRTHDTSDQESIGLSADAVWLRRLRRSIISWYSRHGRDLPWRDERDAYRVWIREIMLQQTTVTAVIPYLQRFMQRFPTLIELAHADEAEVLHAWEGLGYYSRARNLHRTARLLLSEHDGEFPRDAEGLQSLPGIGRYTAGAIASFAFGARAPIVEANTLRLYTRLLGYRHSPKTSRGQTMLWEFASRILPTQAPGQFNQALMDLGAVVCTAENPSCTSGCPLTSQCRAFATGEQHLIPLQATRPAIESTIEAAVVVRDGDRFLIHQRPQGVRWAGLWDFPRYTQGSDRVPDESLSPREINRLWNDAERSFSDEWNLKITFNRKVTEIVHHVTRYRIRLVCFLADVTDHQRRSTVAPVESREHAWVRATHFEEYAMPVSGRKLAKLIASEMYSPSEERASQRKKRSASKKAGRDLTRS
ncbi:MAG: A/G-specific adenine glycosylase [Planctomycetota bacterium]|nr:A/G-specific adenine glycosylase [Planctomycetota bacterium]MDA1212011.1 A/G-specific adenine glycosylase [Planctomycetota bacterium]